MPPPTKSGGPAWISHVLSATFWRTGGVAPYEMRKTVMCHHIVGGGLRAAPLRRPIEHVPPKMAHPSMQYNCGDRRPGWSMVAGLPPRTVFNGPMGTSAPTHVIRQMAFSCHIHVIVGHRGVRDAAPYEMGGPSWISHVLYATFWRAGVVPPHGIT